jgi:hypothetical protein
MILDLPRKESHPVPIGEESGWDPEPVWTLYRTEKNLLLARNRAPAVQSVARRYTIPELSDKSGSNTYLRS